MVQKPPIFKYFVLQNHIMRILFFSSAKSRSLSLFLGIYLSSLILIVILGFYMLFYGLALVSFLFLAPHLQHTQFFKKIKNLPLPYLLLFIYLLALGLRGMMLWQNQIITKDMSLMVERSRHFINGETPYKDFSVNKPPLYLYLAYFIGITFGTGVREFRLFFILLDAAVPLLLFLILRISYDKGFSAYASFLYSICPLNIIMIGFSGHYEPVVLLSVLLAFYFFFKREFFWAALLLGVGFAFKLYPVVIFPFFLVKMPNWKKRLTSLGAFFLPFLLSLIPLYLLVEDGFAYYLDYQTGEWVSIAIKSYALSLILLFDSENVFGIRVTEMVMYFFLSVLVFLFLSWLGKEEEKVESSLQLPSFLNKYKNYLKEKPLFLGLLTGFAALDSIFLFFAMLSEKLNKGLLKLQLPTLSSVLAKWYGIIVVAYAIYYGLVVATTFKLFKAQWGITHANPVVFTILFIYFPAVFYLLKKFSKEIFPSPEKMAPELDSHQEMYYLSTFSIMLLLFSSPNYCPWYIMWFLPFILSFKNWKVKYFLLWLIFWNFPGKDFLVMPGLKL